MTPAAQPLELRTKGNGRSSGYVRDGLDFYVEPIWCTELLLDAEYFLGPIWDPACGSGNVVAACRARRFEVMGSDLAQRPGLDPRDAGHDFLNDDPPEPVGSIICNPPFRHAEAFIRHALEIAEHKVAMILPLKFLASTRRYDLFKSIPVSCVYTLSSRPSMPPGGVAVEAAGGFADYCWLVATHGHKGPPLHDWLIRPQHRKGRA